MADASTVLETEVEIETTTEETEPHRDPIQSKALNGDPNPAAVDPSTSAQGEETEATEGAEDEPEEEIEFDFGGNKFRAPKAAIPENVASELDKFSKGIWSDYSRKSGEIAERARSLEARERAVEALQGVSDETLATYSRGLNVRSELEQLQKIDLPALWQSDADRARRVSDAISAKQAEFHSIVARVSQLETQLTTAQQQEAARRRDEGRAIVARAIPEFEQKVLPELAAYMVREGLPKEDVGNWPMNPLFTRIAHKAMLYDRLHEKAAQAAKPKPAPAQPVKPAQARGGARPNLDLVADADKMSTDEWLRRRNQQLGKRK